MAAAPGELHLPAEPPQRVGVLQGLARREHLDGHPLLVLVGGQVDLPHAPLPQGVEQSITAQDEATGRTGEQLSGLVLGQPASLDQPTRQLDGLGTIGREPIHHLGQDRGRD